MPAAFWLLPRDALRPLGVVVWLCFTQTAAICVRKHLIVTPAREPLQSKGSPGPSGLAWARLGSPGLSCSPELSWALLGSLLARPGSPVLFWARLGFLDSSGLSWARLGYPGLIRALLGSPGFF